MIGIYKITSPSKRVYIGQAVCIEKRRKNYENIYNCKNQRKLYNSILKYGFSKHIFEVVEECEVEELNARERYWQDFYNVISEQGLNCRLTTTEDRSGKQSKESIKRMSENSSKPILQYTVSGLLIRDWTSGKEAAKSLDISGQGISGCCRGIIKSAGGFIWRYKIGTVEDSIQVEKVGYRAVREKLKKPIIQYSKSGVFIREWESATEVKQVLGIRQGDVSACLTGRQSTAKGFIWKYKKNLK